MKLLVRLKENFPSPVHIFSAILSAVLLILAFPGFEFWFLAWFALIPLFFAINQEKNSIFASFILGWIFGICFFFGSCWWLTYAPITYAKFPALLAYFLLFCATLAVGFFSAIFAGLFSILLKRFGNYAIFSAPFIWIAIEFLRFWTTGNNWNAIAYSQAFSKEIVMIAGIGGIYLVGFLVVFFNSLLIGSYFLAKKFSKIKNSRKRIIKDILFISLFHSSVFSSTFTNRQRKIAQRYKPSDKLRLLFVCLIFSPILFFILQNIFAPTVNDFLSDKNEIKSETHIIALQPNVPMSGLTDEKWLALRKRHVELSETAISKIKQQETNGEKPITVIFPESPMNFMYERDEEFQKFVGNFARKNNVSVLFNAAEPDAENNMFFNSAVLVNADGRKIAQYDKIYLVPFGESVPAPLQNFMPALVGSFSYGKEYDLLPFGDARGGVMICFESHFPNLSREYVRNGADVLIEMTNDGYLGNTPVLRQHLANAVFRAVETGRPLLRVTNVGITAYINERGEISDAADVYSEATRTWIVTKSNGEQTFYVRYGDWFAWLCILTSLGFLIFAFLKRKVL